MKNTVSIAKSDKALLDAWCEGYTAADKPIAVNPYAQTAHWPRMAAQFTEGFNIGRQVRKVTENL